MLKGTHKMEAIVPAKKHDMLFIELGFAFITSPKTVSRQECEFDL